jgi:hypothetical protein
MKTMFVAVLRLKNPNRRGASMARGEASNRALRSRELIERTSGPAQTLIPASTNPSRETPRTTRQCSRIEDIFAPGSQSGRRNNRAIKQRNETAEQVL